MQPKNFLLWEVVYQQTRRWLQVKAMANDLCSDSRDARASYLQIIKLPETKKGFVLLPRRWVVERSFGWLASECLFVIMNDCLKYPPGCIF